MKYVGRSALVLSAFILISLNSYLTLPYQEQNFYSDKQYYSAEVLDKKVVSNCSNRSNSCWSMYYLDLKIADDYGEKTVMVSAVDYVKTTFSNTVLLERHITDPDVLRVQDKRNIAWLLLIFCVLVFLKRVSSL